eukprot:Gb_16815 [translate_table: standard]
MMYDSSGFHHLTACLCFCPTIQGRRSSAQFKEGSNKSTSPNSGVGPLGPSRVLYLGCLLLSCVLSDGVGSLVYGAVRDMEKVFPIKGQRRSKGPSGRDPCRLHVGPVILSNLLINFLPAMSISLLWGGTFRENIEWGWHAAFVPFEFLPSVGLFIFKMTEPSKVLHIRNVGHEISENDLLNLVQHFGMVTKLVMLRAKNQALLQMHDVSSSIAALQYFSTNQPSVRGRNVYIQFSSHQELTTVEQSGQTRQSGDQDSQPNRILLVTIHHLLYPITVEVLHQVFSPYGFVEKIVTFQKSAGLQALIQYSSRQHAVQAKNTLQGRNIYDGCCQLDIQFSNLNGLQVHYNNERSRDFTNPSLPSEQKGRIPAHGNAMSAFGETASMYGIQPAGSRPAGGGAFLFWGHVTGCQPRGVGLQVPFQQVGGHQAIGLNSLQMPIGTAAAVAAAFGGVLPPGITGTNDRCTVLVSNLNPEKIDEDKLFNLFSIYGNIIRIKLLRNKPDHALIQMGDGFQAEMAVHYLKGAVLFDKRMEVNFSKHAQITAAADTHDYSSSNLNRFNRNVVKNYRYCCAPTKMIHVSSLPNDVTEDEIVSHLEPHGNIVNTKLFEANGKKQALVLFENEEQATEALVCKHATTIDGSTIRISFSQLQSIQAS